jgi:hypothetical protein
MLQALRTVMPRLAAMSRCCAPGGGDAQQRPGAAGQETPARIPNSLGSSF